MAIVIEEKEQIANRTMVRVFQAFGLKVSEEEVHSLAELPKPVAIRQLLKAKNSKSIKISESWVSEIHKRFMQEMDKCLL